MISKELEPNLNRTWAEIDLDAVENNFKIIKKHLKEDTMICCVVKANAYGHGAVKLAKFYEKLGANYFAVSNINEAIQLRKNGISLPILILGYTDPKCAKILAINNISQCVYSKEYGFELAKNASICNKIVKIHIKLDTGMGRIGFVCKENHDSSIEDIKQVCVCKNLDVEGVFTHFSSADEGLDGELYTKKQFRLFMSTIRLLEKDGLTFKIKHCANSSAILDYPEMQLDMVRAGIILYGLNPSKEIRNKCSFKPIMRLCTLVDNIKLIKKGDFISYGRTYKASENRLIATLPIGYADGLWRSSETNGLSVKINNLYAPIVGRICMDQCMVDVTNIKNIKLGSEVTVFGYNGTSIDDVARINGTINYEIVCSIGERVPRVYIKEKNIVSIIK